MPEKDIESPKEFRVPAMRGRIFVWLLLLLLLQLNDNSSDREDEQREADEQAVRNHEAERKPGPRVLGLRFLSDVYRNESERIGNFTFRELDMAAMDGFRIRLVDEVVNFNASDSTSHDPVRKMLQLWSNVSKVPFILSNGSAIPNVTGAELFAKDLLPSSELRRIPPLDLPIVTPLVEDLRNRTLRRYLAPHVFYTNLSATFTGKWTSLDLNSKLPSLPANLSSSFFKPIFAPSPNSSLSNATTTSSNISLPLSPNPLAISNRTAALAARGPLANATSGRLSLTLFGNTTVTDSIDLLTVHLVIRPTVGSEAGFVGYALHDLPSGSVWLLLVQPGRELPLDDLLSMLPRPVFERGKQAARRFLGMKVAEMTARLDREGADASETFQGPSSGLFGEKPAECRFEGHLQLEPLGRPWTRGQVEEYEGQLHGEPDGRWVARLPQPRANILLHSRDCMLALEAETKGVLVPNFFSRLRGLAAFLCLAIAIEFAGILAQFQHTQTLPRLARVSLATLGISAGYDAVLSAASLVGSTALGPVSAPLAAVAFLKLSSAAIFQGRYVLLVLRARRIEVTAEWFRRFYAVWVVSMLLFWSFAANGGPAFRVTVGLAVCGMLVPQIVLNARKNTKGVGKPLFWAGLAVGKAALPAYVIGCPENVVNPESEGSGLLLLLLSACMAIEVLILVSQDLWGGRWFLPRELFPPAYDYHPILRAPDVESGLLEAEPNCAVCYTPLDLYGTPEQPPDRRSYMVTPCNHHFCSSCLGTWMEEKMECPVCRQPLPPVE